MLQLRILVPDAMSLKDKRRAVKSLKDRIAHRFNVSVAEVDHNDLWQRALIGVAVVANQNNFARQVLSEVLEHIQRENGVEVINYNIEIN